VKCRGGQTYRTLPTRSGNTPQRLPALLQPGFDLVNGADKHLETVSKYDTAGRAAYSNTPNTLFLSTVLIWLSGHRDRPCLEAIGATCSAFSIQQLALR
jgi:hypothetical protein